MSKETVHRLLAFTVLLSAAVAANPFATPPAIGTSAPTDVPQRSAAVAAVGTPAESAPLVVQQTDSSPLQITELLDGSSASQQIISGKDNQNHEFPSHVGINGRLAVVVNRALPLAAGKYVLFLNGAEIKGLDPATENSFQTDGHDSVHALVFQLKSGSASLKELLKSPSNRHVAVVVSLGEKADQGASRPTIVGSVDGASRFQFEVFTPGSLWVAIVAVLLVFVLVWGNVRSRTTLRDSYLPQLPPSLQTYSLGRWQMAFWFTLIFAAFVFLYVLLLDPNTISPQALALMGISGTTALAAVGVDVYKDSPADAANRGLRALGLNSYADVLRVQREVVDLEMKLANLPPVAAPALGGHAVPSERERLQAEIQDRKNILLTYQYKTQPFVTQGWFKDITTDLNGPAVHRIQVFCWTVALGIVFAIEVFRGLSMPDFSANLLAVMGISSAGYVGFKFPEVNT